MSNKKMGEYLPVIFLGIMIIFVVSIVIARNMQDANSIQQANDQIVEPTDSQVVKLGLSKGNYNPQVITLAYGKPVTLQDDGSLAGCALYVSQPQLGINANFAKNKEYTFTPIQKGSFRFACSMNMYSGTMNVV